MKMDLGVHMRFVTDIEQCVTLFQVMPLTYYDKATTSYNGAFADQNSETSHKQHMVTQHIARVRLYSPSV